MLFRPSLGRLARRWYNLLERSLRWGIRWGIVRLGLGEVPHLLHLICERGDAMARAKRKASSRQSRLSKMYAKRLARSQTKSRRKTLTSDELPWWARGR